MMAFVEQRVRLVENECIGKQTPAFDGIVIGKARLRECNFLYLSATDRVLGDRFLHCID